MKETFYSVLVRLLVAIIGAPFIIAIVMGTYAILAAVGFAIAVAIICKSVYSILFK